MFRSVAAMYRARFNPRTTNTSKSERLELYWRRYDPRKTRVVRKPLYRDFWAICSTVVCYTASASVGAENRQYPTGRTSRTSLQPLWSADKRREELGGVYEQYRPVSREPVGQIAPKFDEATRGLVFAYRTQRQLPLLTCWPVTANGDD